MKVLLALLLFGQVDPSDPQMKIAWDTSNGPVRSRCVIGEVDRTQLRQEVLRVLLPNTVRVGRFVAYRSFYDRFRSEGQDGTDCSYESWCDELNRRRLTTHPVQCPQVTEAVKIGETIVLRTIDTECRSEDVLLQGTSDPMSVELSGTDYQVLAVTIQPLAKDQVERKDMFSPVHFFVRTDGEVSKDRAMELLEWAQQVTTAPDMSVVLRNDQWFAMHCDFPLIFPSARLPIAIPTKSEFLKTREVYCGKLRAWPVQCY